MQQLKRSGCSKKDLINHRQGAGRAIRASVLNHSLSLVYCVTLDISLNLSASQLPRRQSLYYSLYIFPGPTVYMEPSMWWNIFTFSRKVFASWLLLQIRSEKSIIPCLFFYGQSSLFLANRFFTLIKDSGGDKWEQHTQKKRTRTML